MTEEQEQELSRNICLIRDQTYQYQRDRFIDGNWPTWLGFDVQVQEMQIAVSFCSALFGTYVLQVHPIRWDALTPQFRIKFGQVCAIPHNIDGTDLDRLSAMAKEMAVFYRHIAFLIHKVGYGCVGKGT